MKTTFLSLFFLPALLIAQAQPNLIITNGRIVDGTGNSWFRGDVAIKGDRIMLVSKGYQLVQRFPDARVIDAKNKIVAPGFIDVHAHIEGGVFERPTADNYIYDGVTSVVTGNCGGAAEDLADFFRKIDSTKVAINVASLAGHNTIRKQGMGLEDREATAQELQQMKALMQKAMEDGAVGLSTGLIYLPGMYAPTAEIIALAKVAASYEGVYATHMRNEGNMVHKAINETLEIGRQANIPVQVSHFKVAGNANWGRSRETLDMVINARKEGIDVTIDQYPYTASSTNLAVTLPDWALEGGLDSLRVNMKDPVQRKKIVDAMTGSMKSSKRKDYSYAVVANYYADSSYNGKSIAQINLEQGKKKKLIHEANTILDMLAQSNAQMIYHTMHEKDLVYFMQFPFNMPAADGGVITGKGMPHPRGYGTNARVLAKYVRGEKVIGLEEAIRRMSSLPAAKFNLTDRGLIMENRFADILVFDENLVQDMSVYDQPHQFSTGMEYVIVNGSVVVEQGKHTGARTGRALRMRK